LSSHFVEVSNNSAKPKTTRARYPVEYKLSVVEEAKQTSISGAARSHGIDKSIICKWKKEEAKLLQASGKNPLHFKLRGQKPKKQPMIETTFKIEPDPLD
jgi:transposase-like protein